MSSDINSLKTIVKNYKDPDYQVRERRPYGYKKPLHLSVSINANDRDLDELKQVWQQLFASGKKNLYFQSYEWFNSWWHYFGEPSGYQLSIITVKDTDTLQPVLIWPLVRKRQGLCRVGMWPCHDIGQYGDVLAVDNIDLEHCLEYVWKQIQELEIDILYLAQVRNDAKVYPFLKKNMRCNSEPNTSCRMDFDHFNSWDEYQLGRSKSSRKEQRRSLKGISKLGNVRFEVVNEPNKIRRLLPDLLDMKRKWFANNDHYGRILEQPEADQWLIDTVLDAHVKGRLNLTVMKLDDRLIAGQVAFLSGEELHAYIGAFDVKYKQFGIGRLQTEDAMCWSFENGFRLFDFMPPCDDYKTRWTNTSTEVRSFHCPITINGRINQYFFSERFRCNIKELYSRVPRTVKKRFIRNLS